MVLNMDFVSEMGQYVEKGAEISCVVRLWVEKPTLGCRETHPRAFSLSFETSLQDSRQTSAGDGITRSYQVVASVARCIHLLRLADTCNSCRVTRRGSTLRISPDCRTFYRLEMTVI